MAYIVDLARAATLDVLGETDRAAAIVERRLRDHARDLECPGRDGRAVTVARLQ